jgi:hypothetical protein
MAGRVPALKIAHDRDELDGTLIEPSGVALVHPTRRIKRGGITGLVRLPAAPNTFLVVEHVVSPSRHVASKVVNGAALASPFLRQSSTVADVHAAADASVRLCARFSSFTRVRLDVAGADVGFIRNGPLEACLERRHLVTKLGDRTSACWQLS